MTTKSLLHVMTRDTLPASVPASSPAASVGELRAMCVRTYERDLSRIGIRGPVAASIIRRVLAANARVFTAADQGDLGMDDAAAACLVALRTLIATASTLAGVLLAAEDVDADAIPPPPSADDHDHWRQHQQHTRHGPITND